MKFQRKTIAILCVSVLGIVAVGLWAWPKDQASAVPAAEAAVAPNDSDLSAVSTAIAKATKIAPQVVYPGTVVSRNDSRLASDVEGRVQWVAEVGTIVKAGDVVVRLDNQLAALQLNGDKANVEKLKAVAKYDREHAERMKDLLARKVMSKAAADQAESTRDSNEAALKQAEQSLKRSQYLLDHADIRAPFAGRVVSRLVNPGEYATAGTVVARLVDLSSIEISTQVPIAAMEFLKESMSVTTEVQGKPVQATVRVVVPVGDAQSRTIEVRLSLAAESAFVGDAAKVMVPAAMPRTVLAVPRDALVLREENTYLFKLGKENKVERIAVEVGAKDGDLVEVAGMLKEGERIVTRGAERLEAGQKVRLAAQ